MTEVEGKVRCFYCETALDLVGPNKYTIDHRTPQSRGGNDDPENLVPCCKTCNCRKGTQTAEEFEVSAYLRTVAGRVFTFINRAVGLGGQLPETNGSVSDEYLILTEQETLVLLQISARIFRDHPPKRFTESQITSPERFLDALNSGIVQ